MITASHIVEVLLEDEYDYKGDALATEHSRLAKERERQERDLSFGFSIDTSPEQMVEDLAREHGLELDAGSWDQLSRDIEQIEKNAQALLTQHGLTVSPEGHGGDGALIGTAWVKTGTRAWDWLKDWDENTEPLSTTSGTLTSVEGSEKLYDGVSELGQRVLDVSVGFFDLGKVHAFKEGLPDEG